jgi:hypothetical protein
MVGLIPLARQGKACLVRRKSPQKHSMGMVNGARRHGRIDIGSAGVDQTSPSFVKPFYDV